LLRQTDSLRYTLEQLIHRAEGAYSSQMTMMSDFKVTAGTAGSVLGNLQASAESLKEMVRYEVGKAMEVAGAGARGEEQGDKGDKGEMEEMRERLRRLEEKMGEGK
jgi:hypothetical protein